jgi:hypothetical protein
VLPHRQPNMTLGRCAEASRISGLRNKPPTTRYGVVCQSFAPTGGGEAVFDAIPDRFCVVLLNEGIKQARKTRRMPGEISRRRKQFRCSIEPD